ncbi:MAG: hypothetical protein HYX69_20285 [Planctomycetia bacterium]|nr:hypothetical protein [Planctomycetia bacterium]
MRLLIATVCLSVSVIGCAPTAKPTRRDAMLEYIEASKEFNTARESSQPDTRKERKRTDLAKAALDSLGNP